MKRDLDAVRKLLEIFEAVPAGEVLQTFSDELSLSSAEVIEHIELIIEAGLAEGEAHADALSEHGGYFVIRKLTWSGHDFINAARSNDVWSATKRRIGVVGSWTFGLVLEVLKDEAKRRIGLVIEP